MADDTRKRQNTSRGGSSRAPKPSYVALVDSTDSRNTRVAVMRQQAAKKGRPRRNELVSFRVMTPEASRGNDRYCLYVAEVMNAASSSYFFAIDDEQKLAICSKDFASQMTNEQRDRIVVLRNGQARKFAELGSDAAFIRGDRVLMSVHGVAHEDRESKGEKGARVSPFYQLMGKYIRLDPFGSGKVEISPGLQISKAWTQSMFREAFKEVISDRFDVHILRHPIDMSKDDPEQDVLFEGKKGGAKAKTEYETKIAGDLSNAAMQKALAVYRQDFAFLVNKWNEICRQFAAGDLRRGLVYQGEGPLLHRIRHYLGLHRAKGERRIKQVYLSSNSMFRRIEHWLAVTDGVSAEEAGVLLHPKAEEGDKARPFPLFAAFKLEEAVRQLSSRTVNIPEGGSLVIEKTEAMTTIDINSSGGSKKRSGSDDNFIFDLNMQATQMIPRQLILRGIGGIVAIDYVDMEKPEQRTKVRQALVEQLSAPALTRFGDYVHSEVGEICPVSGVLTLTLGRSGEALNTAMSEPCKACTGTGRLPYTRAVVTDIARDVAEAFEMRADEEDSEEEFVCVVIRTDLTKRLNSEFSGYKNLANSVAELAHRGVRLYSCDPIEEDWVIADDALPEDHIANSDRTLLASSDFDARRTIDLSDFSDTEFLDADGRDVLIPKGDLESWRTSPIVVKVAEPPPEKKKPKKSLFARILAVFTSMGSSDEDSKKPKGKRSRGGAQRNRRGAGKKPAENAKRQSGNRGNTKGPEKVTKNARRKPKADAPKSAKQAQPAAKQAKPVEKPAQPAAKPAPQEKSFEPSKFADLTELLDRVVASVKPADAKDGRKSRQEIAVYLAQGDAEKLLASRESSGAQSADAGGSADERALWERLDRACIDAPITISFFSAEQVVAGEATLISGRDRKRGAVEKTYHAAQLKLELNRRYLRNQLFSEAELEFAEFSASALNPETEMVVVRLHSAYSGLALAKSGSVNSRLRNNCNTWCDKHQQSLLLVQNDDLPAGRRVQLGIVSRDAAPTSGWNRRFAPSAESSLLVFENTDQLLSSLSEFFAGVDSGTSDAVHQWNLYFAEQDWQNLHSLVSTGRDLEGAVAETSGWERLLEACNGLHLELKFFVSSEFKNGQVVAMLDPKLQGDGNLRISYKQRHSRAVQLSDAVGDSAPSEEVTAVADAESAQDSRAREAKPAKSDLETREASTASEKATATAEPEPVEASTPSGEVAADADPKPQREDSQAEDPLRVWQRALKRAIPSDPTKLTGGILRASISRELEGALSPYDWLDIVDDVRKQHGIELVMKTDDSMTGTSAECRLEESVSAD